MKRAALLGGLATVVATALTACGSTVAGTPTWPGAKLEKVLLTESDFPQGVLYDRVSDDPGQSDGAGGPPAMLSEPAGCTDGMTKVISGSAERGPGSAAKYGVIYDGARVVMTVLSWHLDLDKLDEMAERCAKFEAFFDRTSAGIPMTTTKLPSDDGTLIYEQTMTLSGQRRSVYMVFDNIGSMAFFGLASPYENPTIDAKASLPQTFLEIVGKQTERMNAL
jgi:hypothetical protein